MSLVPVNHRPITCVFTEGRLLSLLEKPGLHLPKAEADPSVREQPDGKKQSETGSDVPGEQSAPEQTSDSSTLVGRMSNRMQGIMTMLNYLRMLNPRAWPGHVMAMKQGFGQRATDAAANSLANFVSKKLNLQPSPAEDPQQREELLTLLRGRFPLLDSVITDNALSVTAKSQEPGAAFAVRDSVRVLSAFLRKPRVIRSPEGVATSHTWKLSPGTAPALVQRLSPQIAPPEGGPQSKPQPSQLAADSPAAEQRREG